MHPKNKVVPNSVKQELKTASRVNVTCCIRLLLRLRLARPFQQVARLAVSGWREESEMAFQ